VFRLDRLLPAIYGCRSAHLCAVGLPFERPDTALTSRTGAMPSGRQLRFAILCESACLEAWQARCLDLLLQSGCAQLVLVVTNARPELRHAAGSPRQRAASPTGTRRRPLLWGLYQRYLLREAGALRHIDCSLQIASADRLECAVIRNELDLERFHESDVATIKSCQLDLILQFGFGLLQGEILNAATYGVWCYDHDQERRLGSVPACFWDVMRRAPTTRATLRRLSEPPDRGVVLHTATFATGWHYPRSYDEVGLGSAEACLRVCRAIHAGDDPFAGPPASSSAMHPQAVPGDRHLISFIFNQMAGYLRAKLAKLFCRDQWNVGIVAQPVDALLNRGRLTNVTWLGPRNGMAYLADPIVLDPGSRCRFLAERFEYDGNAKGSIVSCELGADGTLSVSPFLEAEHHLSYPFVLHHEDHAYLIPETNEIGTVLMYSINAGGTLGHPIPLLESTQAVDATVTFFNQRWWLFCSEGSLKLLAFHAEALDGPWRPHELNPLKIDVTQSRPAGPLFEHGGMLLRPAQDCSSTYGAAVVLFRIVELTPDRFQEEYLGRIGPEIDGPYPNGFHTINVLGERCLVDGKRTVFDLTWIVRGRTHARKANSRRARRRPPRPR
jgi:hypothetical protein